MITAIVNQKGGVGKTAIATELAHQVALEERRTLLVDMDPQASATNIVGIALDNDQLTVFDLLGSEPPISERVHAVIAGTADAWSGLACLPAERDLADMERDAGIGREMRLRRILDVIDNDFDDVIIDCPPSLGVLTANALVAADQALIVSEARVESAQAIGEIMKTIANIKEFYNRNLTVAGIVINRRLKGRKDQNQWVDQIRETYNDLILDAQIPDREVVPRAASESLPLTHFAPGIEVSEKMLELAHMIKEND